MSRKRSYSYMYENSDTDSEDENHVSSTSDPDTECVECGRPTELYRCAACYKRYCSKSCYRDHKKTCVRLRPYVRIRPKPLEEGAVNAQRSAEEPQAGSSRLLLPLPLVQGAGANASVQYLTVALGNGAGKVSVSKSVQVDGNELEPAEARHPQNQDSGIPCKPPPLPFTIPLEKLMLVKDDSRVVEMIKSPKLRKIIASVDDSPANINAINDSFNDLMNDPEFLAFTQVVLQILGLRK